MKEIIGGMCTVVGSGMLYLCYRVIKQRDEIRQLIVERESVTDESLRLRYINPKPILKETLIRQQLYDDIEILRSHFLIYPYSYKFLKRSALALIKLTHMFGEELRFGEVRQLLKEAKSQLKRVLLMHHDDQEAIFELGVAHFYLYKFDHSLDVKRRISYCMKAVECFEKVGEKVPESYKGFNMLQKSQSYLRFEAPEVESREMDDRDDEMHDNYRDLIEKIDLECIGYARDCKAAKMWNTIIPDDVDNLRRWGSALIGSVLCGTAVDMADNELLEEAIEKLNKALLLEPDDINTKLQLARARLFHCSDLDGEEAKDLYKECLQLDAELSALNKPSPMILNKMGHVAAISEESSHPIAQSQTSIFNIRSPIAKESHYKNNNPCGFFPMEWPMRGGAPRLGLPAAAMHIPAAAMQMRGLRIGGMAYLGSAAPLLRLLLQQLISRK